ncbi:MAG: methionine--tRNA ligase [Candidatus Bipolaricaulota bacterium]|nr:MAG: methionine--tRNA ligase [Candidatus Bipolaricaulota bacterium]
MDKPRVLVCSAWPYASGVPHLGNLVGCLLSGDVFARYYRLRGRDVLYVSGSDVHGTRVEYVAECEGISPAELAERNHRRIVAINEGFEIQFDNYTTTETETHKAFVRDIYLQMEANGYICTKEELRAYCLHCERFLADRLIAGTCPRCGAPDALGNQCDTCGSILEPEELVDPVCSFCGRSEIEFRKTRHWYLDLERLSDPLRDYVRAKDFQGNVLLYTERMLEEGLRPRAMTRDLEWGIDAPFEGAEGKVIYVWGENALGYVSSVIEHFAGDDEWKRFWFGDDVHQVYTLAKDNIAFHTLIFPGQLIASGAGYHLPDQIAATEYLNWINGQQFSKSRGVGLYCDEALELLDGELWRFYLLYNRPEGRDVDFSWEELGKAINGVLISNVANLVNRVLSFIQDRYDAVVPEEPIEDEIDAAVTKTIADVAAAVESGFPGKALRAACALAVTGNEYFQRKAPWSSGDAAAVTSAFYAVRALVILLLPFVPRFACSVLEVMGCPAPTWDDLATPVAGTALGSGRVLIERIDVDALRDAVDRRPAANDATGSTPRTTVPFDAFEELDLRVGRITAAEPVEGADRLLRLTIDLGSETRVCVSGIRQAYDEQELVGRAVAVVANLEPATIRGIRSECMLLAASDDTGPALLAVDRDVEPGTRIV